MNCPKSLINCYFANKGCRYNWLYTGNNKQFSVSHTKSIRIATDTWRVSASIIDNLASVSKSKAKKVSRTALIDFAHHLDDEKNTEHHSISSIWMYKLSLQIVDLFFVYIDSIIMCERKKNTQILHENERNISTFSILACIDLVKH